MLKQWQQRIADDLPIIVFILFLFFAIVLDVITVGIFATVLACFAALAGAGHSIWILKIGRGRDFATALAVVGLAIGEVFLLLGWVKDYIDNFANEEIDHLLGLLYFSVVAVSLAGVGLIQILLVSSTLRSLTNWEALRLRRGWEASGFFKQALRVEMRKVSEVGDLSVVTSSIYVSSVVLQFNSWRNLVARFLWQSTLCLFMALVGVFFDISVQTIWSVVVVVLATLVRSPSRN